MLDSFKGSKPKSNRVKFQMTDTTTLVVENEYCKIYNDTRSGKPFKVINDEVVPLELREFNMWKNRQKNPSNFNVETIRDENGVVFDYVISRIAAPNAAQSPAGRPTPPAPPTPSAQTAAASRPVPPIPSAQTAAASRPVPSIPSAQTAAASRPVPPTPSAQTAAASRPVPPTPSAQTVVASNPTPSAKASSGGDVITRTETSPKPSRIKFETSPTTELVLENEYFQIYKDTRFGKTFKVINGETVPVEIREINMWKNRQKNPGNFTVEIVKGTDGSIYDYNIMRASEQPSASSAEDVSVNAPKVQVPPDTVISADSNAVSAKVNASINASATPVSNRIEPDKQPAKKNNSGKKSIPAVTSTVGTAPTDRVKFEESPTAIVVVENEFCKVYKNTRSGKTFKVIEGMIAPIELRELNMWKNRQKNPSNFTVEIMKDASGTPFDYIISRINEDGTLTKAPAVAPVAPYVPPENEYVPTTMITSKEKKAQPQKPSEVFPVGQPVGATPAAESPNKVDNPIDRVKFEESPTMYVVLENEFFKIYNDPRRGKTFKVIDGKIVPIELRELNMWKNRQRKPKNFAVEIVRTTSGEIYDYSISRTENSTTAAVESTSTKTNMPPVTVLNSNSAAKKRRNNASRVLKCAICGNEYGESELLLFDNRNFCSSCVEELIKTKLDLKPVDPIQKVIDDVVAADELYCTYSTVTNYPYLDEEFCVNVCTVKKAAEIMEDDTAVQTIDDKDIFFDDLKRFGLKKIIVNGDSSYIYEPEDFDEHVKSEGVVAPKLYFKILNFMQRKDDELRERIAASFIESKVFTFALNDEITEITEENIDDFKPLIITDGHARFCPVFTDFTEARSVGMPFRGLYEIDADLLSKYDITHYIINPSSLGFIMNKSIIKPFIDEDDVKPAEKVADEVISDFEEPKTEEPTPEPVAQFGSEDKIDMESHVEQVINTIRATEIPEPVQEPTFEDKPAEPEVTAVEDAPIEDEMIREAKSKFEKIFSPVKVEETVEEPKAPEVKDYSVPTPTAPTADEEPFSFKLGSQSDPEPEPTPEPPKQQSFTEAFFAAQGSSQNPSPTLRSASKPTPPQTIRPSSPVANQFYAQSAPTPPTPPSSPVASQFYAQSAPTPPTPPVASQFYAQSAPTPPASPVANQFYAQPAPTAPTAPTAPQSAPTPPLTQRRAVNADQIVIKSNNTDGSKKTFKVSAPIYIPDDPEADIETSTSAPSALQQAIRKSQAMFEDNNAPSYGTSKPADEPSIDSSNNFTFSDMMSGIDDSSSGGLDLSSILGQNDEPVQQQPVKPKLTIQLQATEAKVIARDLEVEPDLRVAQILRDQLNESYRKLAKMISEADVMYVEYDSNTKHILIDGNNKGHIFSEKIYADKSVENFAKNGIGVYIKEYKNEELFTMLYEYKRHGIQDLVLDETANWVIISTDTIADMLDVNERKFVPIPVSNPELMFSMTTLFQKLQSKNENPKRKQEIQSLEKLMIREFTSARYILPMVSYDGGDVKPLSIDGKNGVKRILVFSDAFEMKRFFGDKINIVKDYEIITYKELIKRFTVMSNTTVILNEGSLRFEFNEHNCDHINKVMNQ